MIGIGAESLRRRIVSAQPEGQYVQLPVLHVEQNFFHGLRFDPVVGVDKSHVFAPAAAKPVLRQPAVRGFAD